MGSDIELGPRQGLSTPDRLERVVDVVFGLVLVSLASSIGERLVGTTGAGRGETITHAIQDNWRSLLVGIALVVIVAVVWGRHHAIHERVRVLNGAVRSTTVALLVALGALVPVGTLWMSELSGHPRHSRMVVTVAVVYIVLLILLFDSWTRFARDRQLSARFSGAESRQLRLSFTVAAAAAVVAAIIGYLVPLAGPFLLCAAALALPLAERETFGLPARPGLRRKRTDDESDDWEDAASDEE